MKDARLLLEEVRRRLEGTPYLLTETDDGFEVEVDTDDEKWWPLLRRAGADGGDAVVHRFVPDEATETLDAVDTPYRLTWRPAPGRPGGWAPSLVREARASIGRVQGDPAPVTFRFEGGRFRRTHEERVDLAGGRALVEEVARGLGWQQTSSTPPLRLAVFVLSVLVVLVVFVLAFQGRIG